jgi:hypothetical protein
MKLAGGNTSLSNSNRHGSMDVKNHMSHDLGMYKSPKGMF